MKSKTLRLIEKYTRLIEQDEQNPEQMDMGGMGEDPAAASAPAPAAPQETVPLSSPAELRYIEDVILAALMEPRPSGDDRIELENILDMIKRPDAIEKINGQNQTARDLYQNKILPIIRSEQQERDIRDISDQISQ